MQFTRVILLAVARPAVQYFSTLFHKQHALGKKVMETQMFVFIFSTNLSGTFLILRRTERDKIKNLY